MGIVPTWLWDSGPMRAALARVDLAAFVVIFRAASGLSQAELGNLIEGWSQSLVSLMERGLRDALYDIGKLVAFADTVGMPRAALLPAPVRVDRAHVWYLQASLARRWTLDGTAG